MINVALKKSLKDILEEPTKVIVSSSNVSGNSIEVDYVKKLIFNSYCYYNNEKDRDSDLKDLVQLLTEKYKQNER